MKYIIAIFSFSSLDKAASCFSLKRRCKGWLKNKAIEAVLVNPHLVKKNKENRDNTRSKSDRKDALFIADMVKNGYYSPVRFHSTKYEELRVLMANRETVVKRLVSAVNQIHRWVDIVFPELRQVFKILKCKGDVLIRSIR